MQDDPALPGPAATAASSASDATLPPHPVHSHNGHSCHGHGHSHGYDHGHGHHHPHFNDEEEAEAQRRERQHLQEVVLAFLEYDKYAGQEVERRWQHLCQLPPGLAATLPPDSLASNLHRQRAAVGANQAFLEAVVQGVEDVGPGDESLLDASAALLERHAENRKPLTSLANQAKIKATFHSCFREWSAAGAPERAASFGPLLEELTRHLPATDARTGRQHRVLVPGAGLGRLPLEIAARGYACQGNEFSYFMLLTSNFLLNAAGAADAIPVFPFLDQACNLWARAGNSTEVLIPDVCPAELLGLGDDGDDGSAAPAPDFSMTAGDFQEVYGTPAQAGAWDAVVTCFFLDTAPVVIEYVALIHRLLRPGGVWVNLGPLLYHWAGGGAGDARYARSIELSWEEVRHVMVHGFGFELLREERRPDVTYAANPGSMMRTAYDCVLFTARKPPLGQGGAREG